MRRTCHLAPVDFGIEERLLVSWIGNARRRSLVRKRIEVPKFAAATFANRLRQFRIFGEIDEELERRRRAPFLPHEQHRNLRRQDYPGVRQRQLFRARQRRQTFAEGAVADLIMVLDMRDKGRRRQVRGRLAARLSLSNSH